MKIAKMQVLSNKAIVENLQNVMYAKRSGEIRPITSTLTLESTGLQRGKLLEDNHVLLAELQFSRTGDVPLFLALCVIKSSAITA